MLLTASRRLLGLSQRASSHRRHRSWPLLRTGLRSVGTDKKKDKEPKEKPTQIWANRVGKGVGQVIFLNSTQAGALLLASLSLGDPILATLAAVGTVTATGAANLAVPQYTGALNDGLLAYNGCLIGCAAGGFLVPTHGIMAATAWTCLLAPATTATALVLPKLTGGVPQWTWAFNAVALSQLVHLQPLAAASAAAEVAAAAAAPAFDALVASPLVGLSQIFVVNSSLTGMGITAAIASYSPLLAIHGLMGSTIGCLTGGLLLGAPLDAVADGLYGYNAALTSLSVGVFFLNTRSAWILSAAGALATTGIHAGLAALFGTVSSPCLTLPFCIAASGSYLLAGSLPGLQLAVEPHSPEQNK